MGYSEGLNLQARLAKGRAEGSEPDTLLILEHDPVITLGRSAKEQHILRSAAELEALGIERVSCDRGGDVTYHGPGQVVCYPIFNLAPDRQDVRRYVCDLEAIMIAVCAHYGISAGRKEGMIGCWLGDGSQAQPWRKIGAIGVHLARWITTHGLAFNVSPSLEHFQTIVPCGITSHGVSSLQLELGAARVPSLDEVSERLVQAFAKRFGAELV